jgi:uncharacterized protein YlxW (UPF0749 family)
MNTPIKITMDTSKSSYHTLITINLEIAKSNYETAKYHNDLQEESYWRNELKYLSEENDRLNEKAAKKQALIDKTEAKVEALLIYNILNMRCRLRHLS